VILVELLLRIVLLLVVFVIIRARHYKRLGLAEKGIGR
jgi:hypothetical protein